MIKEQIKLEEESLKDAKTRAENIFSSNIHKGKGSYTNEAIILIKKALQPVTDKIKEYVNNKAIRGKASQIREPILIYKDDEVSLAYLVLSAIMDSVLQPSNGRYPPFHCALPRVARAIASRLKIEFKLRMLEKDRDMKLMSNKLDIMYGNISKARKLQRRLALANKLLNLDEYDNIEGVQLGVNLVDAVIKSGVDLVTVRTIVEATNKKRTYLKLTKPVIDIVSNMRDIAPFFVLNYPPLITEPKPWTGFNGSGGYYSDFIDIPLVKLYSDKVNRSIVSNYFDTRPNKTKRFFNVINSIQKTEWKINKRMLDVYNTIYKNQIRCFKEEFTFLGGLPADDLPNPDTEYERPDPEDKEAYHKYKLKVQDLENRVIVVRSKLLATKLGLTLANKFVKYDKIYYTYQVDFRGRLYPIQQHLNPQAAKHMKPLLHFAKGKPLDTDSAYRWFMIHGANVYGYDKLLYDDRIKKMEEKRDEVLRCVEDPYRNTEWTDAEEPFAYLSWCFEYADYLTDPMGFRSHIPIALDASCSGIQIYSGLLLDKKGATAVNVSQDYDIVEVPDNYILKEGEEWYED